MVIQSTFLIKIKWSIGLLGLHLYIMQRTISFLCLTIIGFMASIFGQTFNISNLNWWNPDYLTVTDCGVLNFYQQVSHHRLINVADGVEKRVKEAFPEMSDFQINSRTWDVGLMWTLVKVDGKEAKGISKDEFYNYISDNKPHQYEWMLPDGSLFTTNGLGWNQPQFVKNLMIDWNVDKDKTAYHLGDIDQNEVGFKVLIDWSVDWAKKRKYDLRIVGNNPLVDKEILKEFEKNIAQCMQRDSDNPDVILTISYDAKNSIAYTYIPPKTEYIPSGTTTRKVYNWVGLDPRYESQTHYETIHHQGYNQETNTSELFLEICMLDASRLNESTPPIIYQATVNKTSPTKVDLLEAAKRHAGFFNHPIWYKWNVSELRMDTQIPYAATWGFSLNESSFSWFLDKKKIKTRRPYITHVDPFNRHFHWESKDRPTEGDKLISVKNISKGFNHYGQYYDIRYEIKVQDRDGKTKKFIVYHDQPSRYQRGEFTEKDLILKEMYPFFEHFDFHPYKVFISD